MAVQRVGEAHVRAIFDTAINLQPFIETAALIVTERLTGHYSAERLIEIERYLAAHLASQYDTASAASVTETRAEEITIRTENNQKTGADPSRFWQHVRLLDYKGLLSQDMTSVRASISFHH